MARQVTQEPKNHVHVGVSWLIGGVLTMVVFLAAIATGTHQDYTTVSPIWFVVLIGAGMAVFGIIGLTKRRHTGDTH